MRRGTLTPVSTVTAPTHAIDALFEGYPQLMTVAELAALLRVSDSGLGNWIERGTLPALRLDRKAIRVFRDDARDLLVRNYHRDGVLPPAPPKVGRIDRLLADAPQVLSLREVGDMLRFSAQGVRGWTQRGLLPALQVGAKVIIQTPDVRSLLERSYTGEER